MARVVVTGGCGFLGSHLVDELVARGDEVVVFDAGEPPTEHRSPSVRYVIGDIRDAAALAEAVTKDVDAIYHMAAVVGVDRYLERPADVVDINLLGTRNVLDVATRVNAAVLVASTSEVFGKNPAVPWREDDDRVVGSTRVDRWCYSTSKALAEHLTFSYAHLLDTAIVRYFNVYGPRQRPAFVVSRGVHRALNGKPLLVYDDGGQSRCFTYVQDAVDATIAVATSVHSVGECFNVGSSVETTVAQLSGLVAELTGVDVRAAVGTESETAGRYQDLRRRVPDTSKIEAMIGWRCETDLRHGLARTIEWARANPSWLALPESGIATDPQHAAA